MIRRATVWIALILSTGLVGCALFQPVPLPIYQDGSLTISLEQNPAGAGPATREQGAQAITTEQLAAALRGLYGRKKSGFVQSFIGTQTDQVFPEDQLPLVARELQKGLRQATPQERVAFQLWRPRGRGREETRGAIYLRGSLLYVTLAKFRSPDFVTYKDAEYGSGIDFELLYEPSDAVVHRQQGFASRWLGADSPEVIIDIRKVGGGPKPEAAVPPSLPLTLPAVTVEALQQQINALTESNQDLRAKLKELQERREQPQDRPSAESEELNRLRQELAEIKQLLADKVLELNRLKGKPTP